MGTHWERISEEEKIIKDRLKKEMEERAKRLFGIEIQFPRQVISRFLFSKPGESFKIEVFKVRKGKRNYIYFKKVKKFYEEF